MATSEFSRWSLECRVVVTEASTIAAARSICDGVLDAVDDACNRFRDDSELSRLPDDGSAVEVSPLLAELVAESLRAARLTDGAVDPTVGGTITDLGYDCDLDLLRDRGPVARIRRVPGWRGVRLDGCTLRVPPCARLDLGAIAKADAAERCARAVHAELGTGVLVSLGGDLATAGSPPPGGWRVHVEDAPGEPAVDITVPRGCGVATSSTLHRRWTRAGRTLHHIVDPTTSLPAASPCRTVTVVGSTCGEANAAATATIARGAAGPDWLASTGLPARIVDQERRVHLLGGWPEEAAA